jgi:hypothetical protein
MSNLFFIVSYIVFIVLIVPSRPNAVGRLRDHTCAMRSSSLVSGVNTNPISVMIAAPVR